MGRTLLAAAANNGPFTAPGLPLMNKNGMLFKDLRDLEASSKISSRVALFTI